MASGDNFRLGQRIGVKVSSVTATATYDLGVNLGADPVMLKNTMR